MTYFKDTFTTLYHGDARNMAELPDESVQMCRNEIGQFVKGQRAAPATEWDYICGEGYQGEPR